ncbi:MAG: serine/threonine-protein kinase [Acidobacteria bacterium]|nr:serine/threonine-protein kinase [Acidobacteriota bacterium]MCA1612380.1 serine/threonine-protein kinase [Acidobacteriota bacterium]
MSLTSGSRLGPYEIVEPIGAGGMGEVYRARDTRLERTVAIKVVPDHLSKDEDVRQRFEREAKTISSLSHPHICALYDVGSQDGVEFLVMEFLEGETLTDRLSKGPLPVEQLLRYSIEIADALEKAHRQGIIHRDLKPANVMLTKSGVKLLDFGLAKAIAPVNTNSSLTALPTVAPNLTTAGTILGTFQYMAPEQLEGREADARSDIFAFGAVLYEMATGRKAFEGKSQASLIGSILRDEPAAISVVQPMTPPALDRVVKTCLAKDPEDRWQTARDVLLQLKWIQEGGSLAGLPAPVAARRKNRERIAWGVAAAFALAAAALAFAFLRRPSEPLRTVRFEIGTPEEVTSIDAPRISPDGRTIAFNAVDSTGKTRIWVRPLNALAAQALAGTDGTTRPFWSSDSRSLGFFADGKLKKIDVSGGPAQKICDAPTGADGSWSSEGIILFDGRANDPILRVSAAGGTAVVAAKPESSRKETGVGWPEFLPDGRHFLYLTTGAKPDDTMYRVGLLDSTESLPLAPAQTLVTYAPPGYLLFVRDKTLVAQPFDLKMRKTKGEPLPLAEHIATDSVGLARFSVSRNGTLVYRTGESGNRMLWVDRSGRDLETLGEPGEYHNPTFSPSGDRVAFDMADPRSGKLDIWVRDLARGVNSRFTFSAVDASVPLWSPDGRRIVFRVGANGDLFEKPADGEGQEKPLLRSDELKFAMDFSRDGRFLLYGSRGKETSWDIWVLPTFGDGKPFPFLKTQFSEIFPILSPDRRYLAYQSNESGRAEVYVQSFPGPGGKWQISTAGGLEPRWRADGKELYYRAPDQKLMAVAIQGDPNFAASVPKALFQGRFETAVARNRYLPSPDGSKFFVVGTLGRESITPTTVALNWFAELGR